MATRDERRQGTGAAGDGVYRYRTRSGVRWRFVFRRADGRLSSRRGYATRAAAVTARHELIEMLMPGVRTTDPSRFDAFFTQIVKEKRAYLTVGALEDLESHGRTRLIPFFRDSELATIDERDVPEWLALMYEDVEAGELSAKTINNARTWLAVVLNEAVRRRLMPRNPVKAVPRLPHSAPELDYLRISEIDRYLDACSAHYACGDCFTIDEKTRDFDYYERITVRDSSLSAGDLPGAHVAGELVGERLRLLDARAQQRDAVAAGECAGGDAAGHVARADDRDVHGGSLGSWLHPQTRARRSQMEWQHRSHAWTSRSRRATDASWFSARGVVEAGSAVVGARRACVERRAGATASPPSRPWRSEARRDGESRGGRLRAARTRRRRGALPREDAGRGRAAGTRGASLGGSCGAKASVSPWSRMPPKPATAASQVPASEARCRPSLVLKARSRRSMKAVSPR